MSRKCELTGKGPMTGNTVSHANNKHRTRWLPNLKKKKFVVSEIGQTVTANLSAKAIRTIDKQGGFTRALRKAKPENLSASLLKVRNALIKKGV